MRRGLPRLLIVMAMLPLVGAMGFKLIEGWSFFDSLYMAVTTLTTVGFQEVHPLSTAGRTFVMVYLTIGLGFFSYSLFQWGEWAVRAEITSWLDSRRRSGMLKTLQGHVIVCGFGRMGRMLCRQLAVKKLPFIAVDRDESNLAEAQQEGWPWILGDATDDRTLQQAGIDRARGLACVLANDADNLFVVLSARLLNRDLQIVSRAADDMALAKMEKAGANRVVSMYNTGAIKMAQLLANPDLEDFIEIFTTQGSGLDLAEIKVTSTARWVGKTLGETDFRALGVMIVGIRRANGELILPPPSTTRIEVDDQLIALGKSDSVSQLLRSRA